MENSAYELMSLEEICDTYGGGEPVGILQWMGYGAHYMWDSVCKTGGASISASSSMI
jgi:hypothetical protein